MRSQRVQVDLANNTYMHANARYIKDPSLMPGFERFPGEGNSNPLQYSCLENPMDRGAWQATVHGVPRSLTQMSDMWACTHSSPHTHTHTRGWIQCQSYHTVLFFFFFFFWLRDYIYSCFIEKSVRMRQRGKESFRVDQFLSKHSIRRSVQFSSVQSLSRVRLFVTPWIAAR